MTSRREPRPTPIAAVLDELDAFAAQWDLVRKRQGREPCRRSRNRRPFRTPCRMWYIVRIDGKAQQEDAWTRNLSERGIGLLAKSAVPVGRPVEVQISPPDRPPMHVAGLVIFCRLTPQGYYELGISLKVRQDAPIFAHDPEGAMAVWPWFQRALRQPISNKTGA
jgi:hypothetical protein